MSLRSALVVMAACCCPVFVSAAEVDAGAVVGAREGAPAPMRGADGLPNPKVKRVAELTDLVETGLDRTAPLSAEDVRKLIREATERDKAGKENNTGKAPATPTRVMYTINLSPEAREAPPLIHVVPGEGCLLSVVDLRGRPWPLDAVRNMGKQLGLEVTEFGSNSGKFAVGVNHSGVRANILLAPQGLGAGFAVTVVTDQPTTHYEAQLVVPRYLDGVDANVGAVNGGPEIGDGELTNYLLNDPPASAKVLGVDGLAGKAWQLAGGRMVLRTSALVHSPAWFKRRSAVDGTHVYELPINSTVLATVDGAMVMAQISGFDVEVQEAVKGKN